MILTSIIYFIFLASTFLGYSLMPLKYRNYILIIASVVFYAFIKPSYLLIIVTVIGSNYYIGIKIGNAVSKVLKARYLYFSLLVNLGILIYFKYWNLIIDNLSGLLNNFKLRNDFILTEIILPLGLSFYIFQTIGYILDIYRGALKPEKDFAKFCLFTIFFPKLLVGPIERAKNILPQLSKDRVIVKADIIEGSRRILWGLFKKIVVADRISMYVDAIYLNLPHHNSSSFVLATLLYPLQVYADFSGYTDIAIGTAKLFGINLMENFKRPLFAKNVSDFWRRWHISLSSWVSDYIYNPIVLKRRNWGNIGVFYGLFIAFIVIGVWHGPTWNFVIFGVLQASAVVFEFLTKGSRKNLAKQIPFFIYIPISIILTYLFFAFSLIIFRTATFSGATQVINIIFSGAGKLFIDQPSTLVFIFIGSAIMLISDYQKEYRHSEKFISERKKWIYQQFSYAMLLIYILLAGVFDGGQFIYFAF